MGGAPRHPHHPHAGGRNEARYRDLVLGSVVTAAIARRYELEGEADGFSLYRPIELHRP